MSAHRKHVFRIHLREDVFCEARAFVWRSTFDHTHIRSYVTVIKCRAVAHVHHVRKNRSMMTGNKMCLCVYVVLSVPYCTISNRILHNFVG